VKNFIRSFFVSVSALFVTILWASSSSVFKINSPNPYWEADPQSFPSGKKDSDTNKLKYPMHDESHGLPQLNDYNGGLYLNDPSNIKTDLTYDPDSNQYNVTQKMGKLNYRPPSYMTPDEYVDYEFK
jgi:hypothetical protein